MEMEVEMDRQNQAFEAFREELKKLANESEKENFDAENPMEVNNQTLTEENLDANSENKKENSQKEKPESLPSYSIDENIYRIRSDLKKSCEIFQAAGEAFESLNFDSLKFGVKDLNLKPERSQMDLVLQGKDLDGKLNKLSNIMGYEFKKHPGEFGDLPELSSFFKACSQLKHGLEKLEKHRSEMDVLREQIDSVSIAANQKIEEINKKLKNKN